jgi:energy-coupling factor transport system permease protein
MRRTIFACYEQSSLLHRLNPTVKLALVFLFMIVATLLFDFWTLILIFLTVLLITWQLGRIPLPVLLRGLLPFLVLGLGYVWMNGLFPRTEGSTLFQWGAFRVVAEGVVTGVVLTVRALCFGICSLFFISTTDPTAFIISLSRQLGLSPRLAYGTLAAYRFLPLLEAELAQIRAAHRLRGVGEGEGVRGKLSQLYRYTLPLLASAIRRAGRVATAMESRAFTGNRTRTYYREVRVSWLDWVFVAGALMLLGLILTLSWSLGWLHLWHGELGF